MSQQYSPILTLICSELVVGAEADCLIKWLQYTHYIDVNIQNSHVTWKMSFVWPCQESKAVCSGRCIWGLTPGMPLSVASCCLLAVKKGQPRIKIESSWMVVGGQYFFCLCFQTCKQNMLVK